jgi:hypothetical protein
MIAQTEVNVGVVYADVRNLFERFRSESTERRVITLGRLQVYLHGNEITHLRKLFANDNVALDFLKTYKWSEYSERLFKSLFKCTVVDSLDFSDYEGATITHDLQIPVPDSLCGQYDLVFDGGTLEHVFNLPVALANVIRLARINGLIYINSPSNNLSGHGFYQFSPELMYRVISPDNGMDLILNRIGVARFPDILRSSGHRVYDVVDPDSVQCRVGLLSSRPVYLMVMGRKTSNLIPFMKPVLQSDYKRRWNMGNVAPKKTQRLRGVFDRLPAVLRALVHRLRVLGLGYQEIYRFSLRNTRFYRRVW